MGGMFSRFYHLVLFFCVCLSAASAERRFSDFKRCADDECSMLLCRGKAAKDFSGPDCRFLSFKTGETIYVYYKLSGQRSDVWAGSVGSSFGYFPKDLLNINHIYTDKEVEVPAEETDFVCFDTGRDRFDSYDIDLLLRDSLLLKEADGLSEKPEGAPVAAEEAEASLEEPPEDTNDGDIKNSDLLPEENETEEPTHTEDTGNSEATQPPSESASADKDSYVAGAASASHQESAEDDKHIADEPSSSEHVTEVEAQPELKTTLGSTFDAVTSDDEDTRKVTPYFEEEESKPLVDQANEQVEERQKEPALLSAAEELPYSEDDVRETEGEDVPPEHALAKQEDVTEAAKEDTWSSLGDTVFKIVSGGERTVSPEDTEDDDDDDEDDDDDDEEEEEEEVAEKDSDQPHVQDTEVNEGAGETVHSDRASATEQPVSSNNAEADETVQSNNDSKTEDPSSLSDTKAEEATDSGVDAVTDNPVSAKDSKSGEAIQSNVDAVTENTVSSEDSKLVETIHSNVVDINQNTVSSEDSKSGETIDFNIDTIPENAVSSKDSKSGEKVDSNVGATTEQHISLQDSKSGEMIQSNIDTIPAEPMSSKDSKSGETVQSNVDTIPENLVSSKDSKSAETVDSNVGATTENTVSSEDSKSGETIQSNVAVSENTVSSKDSKLVETVHSNVDATTENPVSSEDIKASETRHSNIAAEPISPNDVIDTQQSEKNSKEEVESNKTSDLNETFNDAVVRSEHETPRSSSEDDRSVEKVAEKTVQHEPEGLSEHRKQRAVDDKKHELTGAENVAVDSVEDASRAEQREPEAEEDSLISQKKDEQIDRAKEDIERLLESTLKAEQEAEEEPELYEEEADTEELLEDENAVLSTKTEEVEESTERSPAQEENGDLAEPEEPTESSSTQTRDTKSDTVPSLDSSVSPDDRVNDTLSAEGADELVPSAEPDYSDSVLRLTLLRDHFKDDEMERIQKHFGLKELLRIEAMFTELEQELKSARESNPENSDDIESTLENILEVSENSILDEIEKMLDAREQKDPGRQADPVMLDEEAAILDDFQELAFYLRQKYSAVSDSVPLVEEGQSDFETENVSASEEVDESVNTIPAAAEAPEVSEEEAGESPSVNIENDESHSQDVGLEEDGGHFNKNKNKDVRASFKEAEDVQRGPQAILENPVDVALGFEMDQTSGALESQSEIYDSNANYDPASTSASEQVWSWLTLGSEFLGDCAETLVAALPEEWRPGPTFHGLPWKPVVATAAVGFLTMLMFTWRTILAVKGRTYQLTEKQLTERIQQLISEKSDVLLKITELNNMIKQHEEKLKTSEKSRSSTQQKFDGLKTRYQDLLTQKEQLSVNISQLGKKVADTQEENKTLNEKMVIMHQRIEKHQSSLKQYEEERSKVRVLMDEAKLREDALKAQLLSFEKDNGALKEQKKSLLRDAKDWQGKYEKLGEDIKVYHKTQKDLEDSLVHKENEIDVLSCCIAELKGLEVCDGTELQNSDAKLANGEAADKKGDPIKLRLKQMMDVSRIKATLSVIEDERNRYLENFMAEQKTRQALEEQFQKVVHDQTNLKNEKTHLESQYKNLQQRLEITTELYQQKENALQQKLTQEELERREKETKLSEVDGRAVQAEEELSGLRQKVKDMQEEMQQNERALKAEISVQEKKAHENWLKARASERALIEERRESANLRQKIVECSDRMSDLEHSLYKSGPPDRHMPPLRRGDSYGPSPVSGGAPSPPLMIEGPGRPPSAPVGRRSEPFGPRPPSDPHGRFSDLGHPLPSRPEMFAPRTSSPCTQDASFQLKSQSQGSFLPSPVRDSPGPPLNAPPKAYGPPPLGAQLPPPPNGPHPSMIRPPNGHPHGIPPGPPLGPDPRLKPPHMDSFGPAPLRPFGPVPPPFARGPPLGGLPPIGPPPYATHEFPPDFAGPHGLPFPPRPFPPGSLPPPGAMVPPPFGARDFRGPTPPVAHSSRDGEMTQATGHGADVPPSQGPAQDSAPSALAEP